MSCRILFPTVVAFLLAACPLHADNGSPADSLINLLNNGPALDDTARYALLYQILSSTDDAETLVKYSDQALKLADKLRKSPVAAMVYKGRGYMNSGELAEALDCFIQAANLYKKENNNMGLALVYMDMSEAYNQLEYYSNAKYYLKNAVEIYQNEKDSLLLAYATLNLGYINYKIGEYDSTLILSTAAGEIFQKVEFPRGYAYSLGNSGLAYSDMKDFGKAEDRLTRAIEILTQDGEEFAVVEFMIAYAGILQQKGDIEKALSFAYRSFGMAARNGISEFKRDAAYRLAELYKVFGKHDSAYHYLKLYLVENDSIKSDKNFQRMADLRIAFEVSKKQAEVDVLEKKKLIQLIVILGLALILSLALGLILTYYQSLKKSKKLTAELEARRLLLEKQGITLKEHQEELLQQKEELQTTLENLRKAQEQLVESEKMAAIGGLVAGVSHEMNTPLGISITAVSNLLEDVQKMAGLYEKDGISRKEFKGFLESAHDTAGLVQKNLERAASLMQSFKQVSADQVTEHQRVFALKEYLGDILLSLRPKFRDKKIEINIDCDENLQLNSYPGVYAQIFTNLLLNSLQHGFHQSDTGTIGIIAEMKKEQLKIHYTDNGKGISRKDLPHIFEPFYTSDRHSGTGLGLNIIYNLVKQKLHGTITCESEPGKGVLFVIEVPVSSE
jgi:signal transduction histidine kinase